MNQSIPLIVYPAEAKKIGFSNEQIAAADKSDGKLSDVIYLNKRIGELWSHKSYWTVQALPSSYPLTEHFN